MSTSLMLRSMARTCVALALCGAVAMPVTAQGSVFAQPASTPEQLAYAKQLYSEGLAALEAQDFKTATTKFEQAYVYAPDKHVFNFNIGSAAYAAGDCVKAKAAFQRFLDLVSDHPERGTAQKNLMEIERSGCAAAATPAPTPTPAPSGGVLPEETTPAPGGDEAPELKSRRREREEAAAAEQAAADAKKAKKYRFNKTMVMGLALGSVGAAGILTFGVAGVISLAMKKKLEEEAQNGPTNFPAGDFSSSDLFQSYVTMRRSAIAAYVGLGVGVGAGTAGIVLYMKGLKKCKSGEDTGEKKKTAQRGGALRLASLGPVVLGAGTGVAASGRFGRSARRGRTRVSFERCD